MKKETRSPLKDAPLRAAGESIRDERLDIVVDHLLPAVLFVGMFAAVCLLEWTRYFNPQAPNMPWTVTGALLFAVLFLIWKLCKYWPRLRRLGEAERGEKVVGQLLEGLREQGYQVFHDVLGEGFNVDHVAIGPGGVFTIETKTWSKPVDKDVKIFFDGESVAVGGNPKNRAPVEQAKAQAHWIKQLLKESAGKTPPVRPVVLFPGWYVEATRGKPSEVWVLSPKALPAFLENTPKVLAEDEVSLLSFHLSRYVRSEQKLRAR